MLVFFKTNFEKMLINAIPSEEDTENCKAKLSPSVYANADSHHFFDERDTADFYLNEIKNITLWAVTE